MASRPGDPGRIGDKDLKSVFSALFVVCAMAGVSAGAQASDAGAAPMSLQGDLMTPAGSDTTTTHGALGSGSGGVPQPKVIYLRYADGSEQHTSNYDPCTTGTVPRFECSF